MFNFPSFQNVLKKLISADTGQILVTGSDGGALLSTAAIQSAQARPSMTYDANAKVLIFHDGLGSAGTFPLQTADIHVTGGSLAGTTLTLTESSGGASVTVDLGAFLQMLSRSDSTSISWSGIGTVASPLVGTVRIDGTISGNLAKVGSAGLSVNPVDINSLIAAAIGAIPAATAHGVGAYTQAETDAKDAATLASAVSADATNLAAAKTYADGKVSAIPSPLTASNVIVYETLGTDAGLQASIATALATNVAKGFSVSVQLSAVNYTLTNSYNYAGQDFSNITISGAAPVVTSATSNTAATIITGNKYSVTLTCNSVTGMSVGQYVMVNCGAVAASSGAWAAIQGVWPITSINTSAKTITIQILGLAGYIPTAGSCALQVICFQTTLTTAYGLSWADTPIALSNFAVIAAIPGATNFSGITLTGIKASALLTCVAAYGFGQSGISVAGIYVTNHARAEFDNMYGVGSSACSIGLYITKDSSVSGRAAISGCGGSFLVSGYGVILQARSFWNTSGLTSIVANSYGAYMNTWSFLTISSDTGYNLTANTTAGVYAYNWGFADCYSFLSHTSYSPTGGVQGNNFSGILA